MADETVLSHIEKLVQEEHALLAREQADVKNDDALADDRARREQVSIELDRCWDLLRQRRALRETGGDPSQAHVRPPEVVKKYIG
jgi:hypothetical protein